MIYYDRIDIGDNKTSESKEFKFCPYQYLRFNDICAVDTMIQ